MVIMSYKGTELTNPESLLIGETLGCIHASLWSQDFFVSQLTYRLVLWVLQSQDTLLNVPVLIH